MNERVLVTIDLGADFEVRIFVCMQVIVFSTCCIAFLSGVNLLPFHSKGIINANLCTVNRLIVLLTLKFSYIYCHLQFRITCYYNFSLLMQVLTR